MIDVTILSDEKINSHGLLGLMEMPFEHPRDKNFFSIMRKLLESQFVQNVIKPLIFPTYGYVKLYSKKLLNYLI